MHRHAAEKCAIYPLQATFCLVKVLVVRSHVEQMAGLTCSRSSWLPGAQCLTSLSCSHALQDCLQSTCLSEPRQDTSTYSTAALLPKPPDNNSQDLTHIQALIVSTLLTAAAAAVINLRGALQHNHQIQNASSAFAKTCWLHS